LLGILIICLSLLYRCLAASIRGNRVAWPNAKLRAHLHHRSAFGVDRVLEFLLVKQDQRLTFLNAVADVGQHVRHPRFYLRTELALFPRAKRSYGLDLAAGSLFGNRVNVRRYRLRQPRGRAVGARARTSGEAKY